MSLIAEALKRAQQGASRRLPPFSFRRPLSGLPRWEEGPWRRLVVFAGGLGLIGVLLIGWLYLTWPPRSPQVGAPTQPLLVLDPTPPVHPPLRDGSPPTLPRTPSPPAPKPAQGSTIPEVLAALESEPTHAEGMGTRKPREEPAASPRRVDPRREVALGRVREALQGEAKQGEKASQESLPLPHLSLPRAAEPPSSPPPVLEVHQDGGKEAAKFFAEALRSQQRGEFARSIEEYEKSIAADPRNPATFNNLGVALKESGRLDLAIEAFQKALALDPKYEKALNNLGVIRYRKGQYEEAIDLFKQALRINPANVESYTNLGIIYLLAERLDDALDAFQQALRHDPKLAEAYYNLGLLWERRGHRGNAERHYQKFVELAGERHAPLVAKVKERLRFLARGR